MKESEEQGMLSPSATSRARSLGGSRSRSQGRASLPPQELLARKQQLLSDQLGASANWEPPTSSPTLTASQDDVSSNGLNHLHRRSQVRRAKQLEATSGGEQDGARRIDTVEAKLESLSAMLKNHQEEQQNSNNSAHQDDGKSIESVYILLAKKEKDLQMAAELGKVLLEKNDELSKANERITEDYSHKLELLEQDKHKLKRKLDQLDGEYENRLIELQTDCNILKNQLEEQKQLAKQKEKEKSKLIDDLVQQNQRLTSELIEATKSEELLSSQLEQMNERFTAGFSNRQDHVAQLDALKEEIQIVNKRKHDLERRLKTANSDKGNLQALLEESGDKILLLENLLNEKDGKLSDLLEEISELKESSGWLSGELESMINLNERLTTGDGEYSGANNDKNGLEMVQKKRSQLMERLKELRLRKQSRLKASEFIILNKSAIASKGATLGKKASRIGPRDASLFEELNGSLPRSSPTGSASTAEHDEEEDLVENGISTASRFELNSELLVEIYNQLRRFHDALQARKDSFQNGNTHISQHHQLHLYSPNSTDDSGISADDIVDKAVSGSGAGNNNNNAIGNIAGQLNDSTCWRRLLDSLKALIEEMPCSTCQLMIAERADYEQLQKRHSKLCEELKRKEDELLKLSALKLEQETKLTALEEKCATLSSDLSNCDKPKEEIVKLAWKARDEAVERKNAAEISLAKTRIENMQISSQLMEVVQQKGELSQKLAQFEDDIHYITQHSVKAKFTWEEYAEKLRRAKQAESNANASLNPLAQLLNFSSNVVASSTATNKTTTTTSTTLANGLTDGQSTTNLVRNFTSNRFNLRFWQKSSGGSAEKQPPSTVAADNDNGLDHKAGGIAVAANHNALNV